MNYQLSLVVHRRLIFHSAKPLDKFRWYSIQGATVLPARRDRRLRLCAYLQSPRRACTAGRRAPTPAGGSCPAPLRRGKPSGRGSVRRARPAVEPLAFQRTALQLNGQPRFGNGKMIISRSDGHKYPGTSCLKHRGVSVLGAQYDQVEKFQRLAKMATYRY